MRALSLALSLAVLSSGMLGCRADSQAITDALNDLDAEERGSLLRLSLGFLWVTETNRRDVRQNGYIETDGTFTTDNTTENVDEVRTLVVRKVMNKTYVHAADVNGYQLNEVSQVVGDKNTSGNTTTDNGAREERRGDNVWFELDGWVRTTSPAGGGDQLPSASGSDDNEDMGSALYPVAPRSGLLYTTDQGAVWEATGDVETVMNIRAARLSSIRNAPSIPLANLFEYCYEQVPNVGTPTNRDYVLRTTVDCNLGGPMVYAVSGDSSIYVGRQLVMRDASSGVRLEITRIACGTDRLNPTSVANIGQPITNCAPGASVYFAGRQVTHASTTDVIKMEAASDKQALPQIADAGE